MWIRKSLQSAISIEVKIATEQYKRFFFDALLKHELKMYSVCYIQSIDKGNLKPMSIQSIAGIDSWKKWLFSIYGCHISIRILHYQR